MFAWGETPLIFRNETLLIMQKAASREKKKSSQLNFCKGEGGELRDPASFQNQPV